MRTPIAIVDYGAANLLSITRALEAVGAVVTITSDPAVIDGAAGVVLPGVGAAGTAMANLRASGADGALRRVAAEGRPLLGLCLGLQLFFERLAEDDAEGLGLLAGEVPLLPPGRKVPHMGWNALTWTPGAPGTELFAGLDPGIYAYFVHSYSCVPADSAAALAWTDYGMPVLAAAHAPRLWGLQFHPEKSGAAGLRMLANWVALVREEPNPLTPLLEKEGGNRRAHHRLLSRGERGVESSPQLLPLEERGASDVPPVQLQTPVRVRAGAPLPQGEGPGVRSLILYPAIDLLGGRCVRLRQGDYDQAEVFDDDPVAVARRWQTAGAAWLHVVDLDGARVGRPVHLDIVRQIAAATGLPVQLGGGLRTLGDVAAALDVGVARVILGTAAARDPELLAAALARWGERITAGVDARGGRVAVAGWRETTTESALDLATRLRDAGVQTIVVTSIERDGTLAGSDTAGLRELRSALPDVGLIAAGGVATLDDVRALARLGLDGAVLGRALYAGTLDLGAALALARAEGGEQTAKPDEEASYAGETHRALPGY